VYEIEEDAAGSYVNQTLLFILRVLTFITRLAEGMAHWRSDSGAVSTDHRLNARSGKVVHLQSPQSQVYRWSCSLGDIQTCPQPVHGQLKILKVKMSDLGSYEVVRD
jgi:hypothetical protein